MAESVRYGVGLPLARAGLPEFARRAEELGFVAAWTVDTGLTGSPGSLDGLHALSFLAGVTERIRLGISVLISARRNPVLLARELATIDRLSGGRLTVGLGLGNRSAGLAQMGVPVDHAVGRFEEGIELMRALWTGEEVTYRGRWCTLEHFRSEPKPLQQPVPVWFGAGAEPALGRAVKMGDGWMGAGSSSTRDFVTRTGIVLRKLDEEGRDPSTFMIAKRLYLSVEKSVEQARSRLAATLDVRYRSPGLAERVGVCGTSQDCAEQIQPIIDAGAREIVLNPVYDSSVQLEALPEIVRMLGHAGA